MKRCKHKGWKDVKLCLLDEKMKDVKLSPLDEKMKRWKTKRCNFVTVGWKDVILYIIGWKLVIHSITDRTSLLTLLIFDGMVLYRATLLIYLDWLDKSSCRLSRQPRRKRCKSSSGTGAAARIHFKSYGSKLQLCSILVTKTTKCIPLVLSTV